MVAVHVWVNFIAAVFVFLQTPLEDIEQELIDTMRPLQIFKRGM